MQPRSRTFWLRNLTRWSVRLGLFYEAGKLVTCFQLWSRLLIHFFETFTSKFPLKKLANLTRVVVDFSSSWINMAVLISLVNFPGHFIIEFYGIGIFWFNYLNLVLRELESFHWLSNWHSILDDILTDQISEFRLDYYIGFVDKEIIFICKIYLKVFFKFYNIPLLFCFSVKVTKLL